MTTATAFATPAAAPCPTPCCQPGRCRYRPGRLFAMLDYVQEAHRVSHTDVPLRDAIADFLLSRAGETALAARYWSPLDSHGDTAHDIEIDILTACAELHCKPIPWNARRIGRYLCPWSEEDTR